MKMSIPFFPSLTPKLIDPAWFNVDQPCDDENEVAQLEREHQAWNAPHHIGQTIRNLESKFQTLSNSNLVERRNRIGKSIFQINLNSISLRNSDLAPIGKTQSENLEEEEEEDDEDDNDDDDESETHDEEDEDEIEMDVSQERNSPVDVSIRMGQGHGVR